MHRLTKQLVETIPLPNKGEECRIWDDKLKGFHVRVKPSGVRTYCVSYRNKYGKLRRLSIGRHGIITTSEARKRAIQILAEVSKGKDPMGDRKMQRSEPLFIDLVNEYIERHCSQKKSGDEDIRIIKKDLLKPWSNHPAQGISRRDVIRLIDKIKDRGSPIMANRTLALIRRIYNFGVARDIVEINPTRLVKPASREKRRSRVLNEKEIVKFWQRLDKTDAGLHIKTALRLILVTAQRPGEVIGAEWSEIDLESGLWTIPEEKSKNGLPHRVPLSILALELLNTLDNKNRFLFPARLGKKHSNDKPMTNRALPHAVRRNENVFKIDSFTPHDLRRTAASHIASMGFSRLVISKILNHLENGVTAIYDRHGYDKEKRTALDAWSTKLDDIFSGKKSSVIPLARYSHQSNS